MIIVVQCILQGNNHAIPESSKLTASSQIVHKKLSYHRDSARRQPLHRSMSFKVTVRHAMMVNNTNPRGISHRLSVNSVNLVVRAIIAVCINKVLITNRWFAVGLRTM